MRPAVLELPDHGKMGTPTAGEQEQVKRKASAIIEDRGGGEHNASDAEHLNGNDWSFGHGAGDRTKSRSFAASKGQMITGCVPCLILGIPCNPNNTGCKLAMSREWSANDNDEDAEHGLSQDPVGLNMLRLDTKWRRNWRERHSLNFFVTFVSEKGGSQDNVLDM